MTIEEKIAKLEKELAEQIADLKAEVKQEKPATRLEPKENEHYAFINSLGEAKTTTPFEWLNSRTKFNNVFRESSEDNLKKYSHDILTVQNRLMQLHEELCPEFLSWDKVYPSKHIVVLDLEKRKWYFDAFSRMSPCVVVFTKDAAEKACEILNAEKFMLEDN